MKTFKILIAILCCLVLLAGTAACTAGNREETAPPAEETPQEDTAAETVEPAEPETVPEEPAEEEEPAKPETPEEPVLEKNGEVYVLFTSDVHCAVDKGWGYAGLQQIRDTLEAQGYETILVDDGDAVQGDPLGTLSKGEAVIRLMNEMAYDVAIPGNHEFDYGMDRFLELAEMAEFPYVSCNFHHEDELVFEPYVILEAAGRKIAFVGVTTPLSLTTSTPKYFQNEEGEFIYGFLQDETGETLYKAVQGAVDDARADGAELVYVLGHMGLEEKARPYTYADVIEHTNGIDVFLDGHTHDSEQIVMKNKDGEDVVRSAPGTMLNAIGYSRISADGEVLETGVWSWTSDTPAPDLLGIENEMRQKVGAAEDELAEQLETVIATTAVDLTIHDPEEKDSNGNPIRMIRRAETNLGDLCADAYRDQGDADIGFSIGGSIRNGIDKGDITYEDIIRVHPFGNMLSTIEATGQQILDALEWGSRAVPGETGGFLQVSGLTYEIHVSVESGCQMDENGMFTGIEGERRVANVMVNGEPLDPEKTYTVAGIDYTLQDHGDGYTMFDGNKVVMERVKLDNQVLIDYITQTLDGTVGKAYADLYGQGRIVIVED